jgi:hypothetical protein
MSVQVKPVEQPRVAATSFGRAWVGLAAALALHVTDEALTDFLSVYNPTVLAIRERLPFLGLPTFSFGEWIVGLTVGILLLFALSPVAFRGSRWLAFFAMPFSVLMVGNALGHIASSIYMGRFMPGVYSSPVLLVAALLAFVRARQVFKRQNVPDQTSL